MQSAKADFPRFQRQVSTCRHEPAAGMMDVRSATRRDAVDDGVAWPALSRRA